MLTVTFFPMEDEEQGPLVKQPPFNITTAY